MIPDLGVSKILADTQNKIILIRRELNGINIFDLNSLKFIKSFSSNAVEAKQDKGSLYNSNNFKTNVMNVDFLNKIKSFKGKILAISPNKKYLVTKVATVDNNDYTEKPKEFKFYIYNTEKPDEPLLIVNDDISRSSSINNNGYIVSDNDDNIIIINSVKKTISRIKLSEYIQNIDKYYINLFLTSKDDILYFTLKDKENYSISGMAVFLYSLNLNNNEIKFEHTIPTTNTVFSFKYIPEKFIFQTNYEIIDLKTNRSLIFDSPKMNITYDEFGKAWSDYAMSNNNEYIIKNNESNNEVFLYHIDSKKILQIFDIGNVSSYDINFDKQNNFITVENKITNGIDFYSIKTGKLILSLYFFLDLKIDNKLSLQHDSREFINNTINNTISNGMNSEWIAITPEGYFNASPNGAKHLNVLTAPLTVTSIDAFYNTFYRPDIVAKVLNGEDTSEYKTATIQEVIKQDGSAPTIAIKNNLTESTTKDVELQLEVCQNDNGGYNNLILYLDGMAIDVSIVVITA